MMRKNLELVAVKISKKKGALDLRMQSKRKKRDFGQISFLQGNQKEKQILAHKLRHQRELETNSSELVVKVDNLGKQKR